MCLYLDDQHVNHARVGNMLVLVEHLPHFGSALSRRDVQLEHCHCEDKGVNYYRLIHNINRASELRQLLHTFGEKKKKEQAKFSPILSSVIPMHKTSS